jgi:hypothetical protein
MLGKGLIQVHLICLDIISNEKKAWIEAAVPKDIELREFLGSCDNEWVSLGKVCNSGFDLCLNYLPYTTLKLAVTSIIPYNGTIPCCYCPKSILLDKHPVIDDEIDNYSYVCTPCIKQSISHLSC